MLATEDDRLYYVLQNLRVERHADISPQEDRCEVDLVSFRCAEMSRCPGGEAVRGSEFSHKNKTESITQSWRVGGIWAMSRLESGSTRGWPCNLAESDDARTDGRGRKTKSAYRYATRQLQREEEHFRGKLRALSLHRDRGSADCGWCRRSMTAKRRQL